MKVGGFVDRAWPWLVTPALLLSECGCATGQQEACVAEAQGTWRNAVAACELEGLTADECGLDRLTEERRVAEEWCLR